MQSVTTTKLHVKVLDKRDKNVMERDFQLLSEQYGFQPETVANDPTTTLLGLLVYHQADTKHHLLLEPHLNSILKIGLLPLLQPHFSASETQKSDGSVPSTYLSSPMFPGFQPPGGLQVTAQKGEGKSEGEIWKGELH